LTPFLPSRNALACTGAAALLAFGSSASAITRFVDVNATGTGDGLSWPNAHTNLATAISDSDPFDAIHVAQGNYTPPGVGGFTIPGNVSIYGGFPTGGSTLANRDVVAFVTTLNGDLLGDDVPPFGNTVDNCIHVCVSAGNGSRLDGFLVRGGSATGGDFRGGGLLAASNITLANDTFKENWASYQGGAIYYEHTNDLEATIVACIFDTCESPNGGAISLDEGTGTGNDSILRVTNSLFHHCHGHTSAAALYMLAGTEATLYNCTITDSQHGPFGTVQMIWLQAGSPDDTSLLMHDCIVWGNGSTPGGGTPISATGTTGAAIAVYNSDIQGGVGGIYVGSGSLTTAGIVNGNPLFVDPSTRNYRLQATSRVIDSSPWDGGLDVFDIDDSGTTSEATPDLDRTVQLAGCGLYVDQGAYEFKDHCAFDLDDDGDIDGYDLAILLASWSETTGGPADFNCDNKVNGVDLALLLGGWGGIEGYPRVCDGGGSPLMGAPGAAESGEAALPEGATDTLAALLEALGLEGIAELDAWIALLGGEDAAAVIDAFMDGFGG
jgi:hypothetical protein